MLAVHRQAQRPDVLGDVAVVIASVDLQLHAKVRDRHVVHTVTLFVVTHVELRFGLVAVLVERTVCVTTAFTVSAQVVVHFFVPVVITRDTTTVVARGVVTPVVAVVTDDSTEVVSMDVALGEVLTAVVTPVVVTVGAVRADIAAAAIHADQIVDVEDLAAVITGEIITVVAVLADDATVIRGVVVIGFDDTATVVTDADLVNVIDVGVHAHSSFLLISVCPTVRGRIDSFLRRSPLALLSSVYQGSSQFSRVYGERFALSLACAHQVGQVGERESNIADRYAVVKVHTSSGEGRASAAVGTAIVAPRPACRHRWRLVLP